MNREDFDKHVNFAIEQGLPPSQAIELVSFMSKCFPHEIRERSHYFSDWIHRWKNEPLAYMDEDCSVMYSLVLTLTDTFIDAL